MKYMDTEATEMIPIRLIIGIMITTIIFCLIGTGYQKATSIIAEQQVEEVCRKIQSTLSPMVESGIPREVDENNGAEGTKRVITFQLPDSLIYLSLGGDPDPRNDGNLTSRLSEDGASIFYKVQGGSKQVIWLPKETIKFREGVYTNKWMIIGEEQSYIIRCGGKFTLTFELVQKNQINYILLHANDNIC